MLVTMEMHLYYLTNINGRGSGKDIGKDQDTANNLDTHFITPVMNLISLNMFNLTGNLLRIN